MHAFNRQAETLLSTMMHDLRQPLGTVELTAYLLRRILPSTDVQVCQHLNTIERQVDVAVRILTDAAAELCRMRAQAAEADIRAFTKSETAVVT